MSKKYHVEWDEKEGKISQMIIKSTKTFGSISLRGTIAKAFSY